MGLSISTYSLWLLSIGLEVCLCVLAFWRGLRKMLPFFTVYLLLQVLTGLVGWMSNREFGFWSPTYYYISWVGSGTLMIGAWLVTAELCYRGFRAFRGIWGMTWRLLLAISILASAHAAYDASKHSYEIEALILVLQRDLAMASAVILVTILIIERRYSSQLDGLERQIAYGLCAYLIAILLSDSMLIQWNLAHWPSFSGHPPSAERLEAWWNGARFVVLDSALATWCFTLRRPLLEPKPAPVLLSHETYGELSPVINNRLRSLNARLMDLLKT